MIKLTKKQKDMLWWESWPYSEIDLKFQTKILDDKISRRFVEVEVNINPTTFEICKQNISDFKDDIMITQLLMYWKYISPEYWYKSCAFSQEYINDDVLTNADNTVQYAEETIIRMHKYVMNFLEIEN